MRRVAPLPLVMLAGCSGEPQLDTSSNESFKASLYRMGKGMTGQQRKQLDRDVFTLALTQGLADAFSGAQDRADKKAGDLPSVNLLRVLNGMTAAEVHAKAEDVRRAKGGN
jgi:hypothetical protein